MAFLPLMSRAVVPVDAYQDFHTGTNGTLLTTNVLATSARGGGAWLFFSAGSDTTFTSWTVTNIDAFTYHNPLQVGSTLITSTGTNAIFYDMDTTNSVEQVRFFPPGATYLYSNLMTSFFIKMGAVPTGGGRNYDHVHITGGYFCVCQQQTSEFSSQNRIITHSQNSVGSTNGTAYDIDPDAWYFVTMIRDFTRGRCQWKVYDPYTFELLGESLVGMGISGNFGAQVIEIQAHYLNRQPGVTTIAGISASYVDPELEMFDPAGRIIQESNTWNFATNWNLGVRGGIPARTGTVIDVTQAPYGADKTGSTNAGAIISSAISAASSNDIVYLPAGLYHCKTNGITLNKSGVTLRGDGTNTVIFGSLTVGHSASGGYRFSITNGGTRGTTNLVLSSVTNQFGSSITAGDFFKISAIQNKTNDTFPVISTRNGSELLMSQMVQCYSRAGNTVTISSPLIWDFTNQAILTSRTLTGGGGLEPAMKIGVENLLITGTNHVTGQVVTTAYNIFATSIADCWFSNVVSEYCKNYALGIESALRPEILYCTFRNALDPVGTSRSGAIFTDTSEYLMRDCIFNDLGVAWQHFGGVSGNAAVGIFATNITANAAFLNHSVHNFYNIIEASKLYGPVAYDGYFGSSSHAILYRNRIGSTVSFKRYNTYNQVVGNVLGLTNFSYVYTAAETPSYPTYGIFELGFPNIGNTGFDGITPPTSWSFPGTNVNVDNNTIESNYPNGVVTFSATQGPTNVLYGNFTNRVAPYSIWGDSTPGIIFQDGANTNLYYTGTNPPVQVLTNYGDSILLNQHVTVGNGWTLYTIEPSSTYQQLQSSNKYTQTLHGNWVYTNSTGALVWDANIGSRDMQSSILYTNGAPDWWGTNRWPAIDPETTPVSAAIPAEVRYAAVESGGEESGEPTSTTPTVGSGITWGNGVTIR
jgi:hypothetical protein